MESNVLKRILLECCFGAVRLFRNNVGCLQTKDGRFVRYGVGGNGGSDLIGWRSVIVTPDMVGKKVALFCALEVKDTNGTATKEQESFVRTVMEAGGLAGIVRSPSEAKGILLS